MPQDDFNIENEILSEKDVIVLHLSGYLDAHTFERLEEAISSLFKEKHFKLVVDLERVEYISSAGAGVLIGTLSVAHEHNGNIILMNPTPNVREVFDLLGLTQVFQVVDGCSAALAAF